MACHHSLRDDKGLIRVRTAGMTTPRRGKGRLPGWPGNVEQATRTAPRRRPRGCCENGEPWAAETRRSQRTALPAPGNGTLERSADRPRGAGLGSTVACPPAGINPYSRRADSLPIGVPRLEGSQERHENTVTDQRRFSVFPAPRIPGHPGWKANPPYALTQLAHNRDAGLGESRP